MSRLPIRARLALAFALVMALVFAAVGAILYVRLGDTLDERIAETLDARTTALASTLDPGSPVVTGDEGVAQVLDADGSIVASRGAGSTAALLSRIDLERVRKRPIVVDTEIGDVDFRLHATAVGDHVIVVGEPLDDRADALAGLLEQLLVVLPIALLVSSVIGYLVAGAALRPVEAMRRQAAEISAETAGRRLPLPRAHDEVYRLGDTLNEMLDRLDAGLARERRFVADTSHELRTPLATLRTELELATRQPRTHSELEAALHSAIEEVERLVRLAEDLLVLARADEGKLQLRVEEHRLRPVLDAVAARNGPHAGAGGRSVEVTAAPELTVTCDRLRVEQALDSLVDNALRHGDGIVTLAARSENGNVILAVSDQGAGFPQAFLPHAFERFSRGDAARSGRGSGLGLAIVDAIARAHGGTAAAANREGVGAVVTIELPLRRN